MVSEEIIGKNNFIATVTSVWMGPSSVEGICQQDYVIELADEDGDLHRVFVPISQGEEEKERSGSILYYYLEEIRNTFPETREMVSYHDIFKFLTDKKVTWMMKPLGRWITREIPPLKFLVPRRI